MCVDANCTNARTSDNTLYDEENRRAALGAVEKANAIDKDAKDDGGRVRGILLMSDGFLLAALPILVYMFSSKSKKAHCDFSFSLVSSQGGVVDYSRLTRSRCKLNSEIHI